MKCTLRLISILYSIFIVCCPPSIGTAASLNDDSNKEQFMVDADLHELLRSNKITLEAAQLVAIRHSGNLVTTEQQKKIASYRQLQFTKQYFADVSLKAGTYKSYGEIDDTQGSASDNQAEVFTNYIELRVVMPWGHKKGLLKDAEKAQKDESIAHEQYLGQMKDLNLRVYNAYFNVVLQDKQLSLKRKTLEIAEARKANMQNKYELGTCSRLDIVSAEANVLSNRVAVESAQSDRDEKYRALLTLMNIPPITNLDLNDSLQFKPYEKKDLDVSRIVSAKTSQQRLEIDKSQIALEKSRQSWFPKLSAYIGYRNDEREGNGSDSRGEYYGAVLEWPFPVRGEFEATAAAKIEKDGAVKSLLQAEENIRRRIIELEHQVEHMERVIRLDEQLMAAKKLETDFQRSNFALGRISSVELNLVEATALGSEIQYFKDVYKHMTVVAELNNLTEN